MCRGGLLIRRFRKMSDTGAPATYTAKTYINAGEAYVVGVKNKEDQDDLVKYIKTTKKGEKEGDWFELFSEADLLDVNQYGESLDKSAQVFKLTSNFS